MPTTDPWMDQTPATLSVSELTAQLKGVIQECFPAVWVEGEISNLTRHRSGHVYLSLKDHAAQIRAVIWRGTASKLPFRIEEGQRVMAMGGVEVYPPQGSYQLIIRKLEPQGIGALQLAFEQLRKRLDAEGLFDPSRKLSIPHVPRRIGLVTSPTGAAVRDFLQIALRRWPDLDVTIIPAKVQGPGAAQSIVAAITAAHRIRPALDLLVVTRGGGSLEDLWCFNEEPVVRAIAACRLPVVSAVGHEIDVTLADFAADLRALTPSDAAQRVIADRATLIEELRQCHQRMRRPIDDMIRYRREQLRQISDRAAFKRPFDAIHLRARQLDEFDSRARRAIRTRLAMAQRLVAQHAATLSALSPLGVLARGYSITQRFADGSVLQTADEVQEGDWLITRLARGTLYSRVANRPSGPPVEP